MRYNSFLTDTINKVSAALAISKVFHRNQFDSTDYGWLLKNEADFYSLFTKGQINLLNGNSLGSQDGIGFVVNIGGNNYVTHPSGYSHHIPPHLDTSNEFVVEDVFQNKVNWNVLYLYDFLPVLDARKIIVKFRFKAKLFNLQAPHDSIFISNGQFQGFFADR